MRTRLSLVAAFLGWGTLGVLAGCSSAPAASATNASAATTSGTPFILVPTSDAEAEVTAVCAAELAATYCSPGDANEARARCETKLGDHKGDCGGDCLVTYDAQRPSCSDGPAYANPEACKTPLIDDCSFYRNCLETSHTCGASGYPLGFGERLCYAFIERRDDFSAPGQAWLRSVRTCLQRSLVDLLSEPLSCDALTDAAYATHPPCYTLPGATICDLPPSDVLALVDVLGSSLLSFRTVAQVHEVAKACASHALGGESVAGGTVPAADRREFFAALADAAESHDEARLRAFVTSARAGLTRE